MATNLANNSHPFHTNTETSHISILVPFKFEDLAPYLQQPSRIDGSRLENRDWPLRRQVSGGLSHARHGCRAVSCLSSFVGCWFLDNIPSNHICRMRASVTLAFAAVAASTLGGAGAQLACSYEASGSDVSLTVTRGRDEVVMRSSTVAVHVHDEWFVAPSSAPPAPPLAATASDGLEAKQVVGGVPHSKLKFVSMVSYYRPISALPFTLEACGHLFAFLVCWIWLQLAARNLTPPGESPRRVARTPPSCFVSPPCCRLQSMGLSINLDGTQGPAWSGRQVGFPFAPCVKRSKRSNHCRLPVAARQPAAALPPPQPPKLSNGWKAH
jgi:hypothetical protein